MAFLTQHFQRALWLLGIFSIALLVSDLEANHGVPAGSWSEVQADEILVATDSSLFAAAVRGMRAALTALEQKKRSLRVDPRPLRSGVGDVLALGRLRRRSRPFGTSSPQSHEEFPVPDPSLFAGLVEYVRKNGLWQEGSEALAVDPRMIDALQQPFSITKRDLASVSSDRLHERRHVLRRLNVKQTDILTDARCVFTGGLPALDSTGTSPSKSARCKEKGAFISVIFGPGRPVEDCSSREERMGVETTKRCVKVRAIEITPYSFFTYDLTVVYRPDSGWTVVDKTQRSGAAS